MRTKRYSTAYDGKHYIAIQICSTIVELHEVINRKRHYIQDFASFKEIEDMFKESMRIRNLI